MWETFLPEGDGDLRQGDLLKGLLIPGLKLPMDFVRPAGKDPSPGDSVVLQTAHKAQDFIVVSQCCELEKRGTVALAPIKSTAPLGEDKAAFLATEPNASAGYVYNALALEPLEGGLDEPSGGRLLVAALDHIQTVSGVTASINSHVRARMTPMGRRLLRIKLSLFWGRVEDEDAGILTEQGVPFGLTPGAPEDKDPGSQETRDPE